MAPCRRHAQGGRVDRPGEQTPSSIRLGERRVRTAGQSIDRPGTTGSRVQALNQRSIAPPATSNMTVGQGPYRPEPRQGKNERPHAYAYIPFVRRRTICIDSPDAPALDGHQALLPHQRLHELPRAAPGARRRHLPRLRLLPPPRLIRFPGPAQAGVLTSPAGWPSSRALPGRTTLALPGRTTLASAADRALARPNSPISGAVGRGFGRFEP